jgi:hypothetical protein
VSPPAAARIGPGPSLAGLQDDFERAALAAGGAVERRLTLAEGAVHLRFAGADAAEALGAAFAHLETDDAAPPSLTLHVWDFATASAPRPVAVPRRDADAELKGAGPSYFFDEDGFRALHQPAADVLSVLSADADLGWFWMPDATALPYWDYTAPFRHLLSWWLEAVGFRQVHGGAVGTADGGVLIVGPSGSGKSMTTLASLLDERFRYAGDDYVAVGGDGEPVVQSLYCSAKVHRADVHRLPFLPSALAAKSGADEKAAFYVASTLPGRCVAGFPLRAIVLPRVTGGGAARVTPGTHAAALAALAPSTIFQLHPPARHALAELADLVRSVPTFVLELGADVETIPGELVRVLEQVG